MSVAKLDMHGKQYGRWKVIMPVEKPADAKQAGIWWLCKCTCGGTQKIPGARLRAGRAQTGCVKCRSHGACRNGMTPEYQSWRGMRERCLNPNHANYASYGGRGITISPRWIHSFESFFEDMGKRPNGHTLDRIDPDGPYALHNCRWADAKTQAHNQRRPVLSDEQVAAIRNLLACGSRQIDVANAVGVSRSHIANIATGHSR